jgi:hypothetical protein
VVESGPGGWARIVERRGDEILERTSSIATDAVARIVTEVRREGDVLKRSISTQYVNGTARLDEQAIGDRRLARTTNWTFADGSSASAQYEDGGRALVFTDSGGKKAEFATKLEPTATGVQSVTSSGARDAGVIIGSKVVHPGSSSTVIQHGPGGRTIASTVTQSQDGTITVTSATSTADGHAAGSATFGADGTFQGGFTATTTSADGQTAVHSRFTEVGATGVTHGLGVAGTTEGGGFFTVTTVTGLDGSRQQSSFSADGQGNSSETTVTHNPDGSFTISTTSTDSSGASTTSTESFDQHGNPSGGGETGGDGNGGNGGNGGDGGNGDGGNGDGGDRGSAAFPSDDGTDEPSNPRRRGSGDSAFVSWLGSHSAGSGAPGVTGDPGDPIDFVITMVDGDTAHAPSGSAGSGDVVLDVGLFVDDHEGTPGEINPLALVDAATNLMGSSATAALKQLA